MPPARHVKGEATRGVGIPVNDHGRLPGAEACPALRVAACLGRGEIFFLLLSRLEGKPPEDLLISAATSSVNRLAIQGLKGESDIDWQDMADILAWIEERHSNQP